MFQHLIQFMVEIRSQKIEIYEFQQIVYGAIGADDMCFVLDD